MRGVSGWFVLLVLVAAAGGTLAAAAPTSALLTAGIVLLVLAGWAVSLCLHEFGHAVVAYRGGDRSVRDKGYLTLDIRRYTDLGYSVVLPIVFLLIGGIPLPGGAVWIDHGALRRPATRSLVSLAGPATTLLVGVVLAVAVAAVPMAPGLAAGLSCLALLQVLAFVLNMLPVPGLDGFGVLEPFLPHGARRVAAQVRPWAPIALFVLLIGVPGVATVFFAVSGTLFALIGGDGSAAFAGYDRLLFWR
jgi:Zn-dependent protease